MTTTIRRFALNTRDRAILAKPKIRKLDRDSVPDLWVPFRDAFLAHVRPADVTHQNVWRAFRFCGLMMLALDRTYWAFDWERLLTWRDAEKARSADRTGNWHRLWDQSWTEVTATLFFLEVLPYRETIYQHYHKELARKWLGEAQARAIEDRFVDTAQSIGYRCETQVRKNGASVLLAVMLASGKRRLQELHKADFDAWEAHTGRSPRVAMSGATMAQRVLGAMGYLAGESPRAVGGPSRKRMSWGHTPPAIVATFERFLADFEATRRPSTMTTYHAYLRRFGDWLGAFDPALTTVAGVRRHHIEAYKQAIIHMRIGEHATPAGKNAAGARLGKPLSASCQVRCLSCVKTFFDTIDTLEYPERPGRALFVRGDIRRLDNPLPRFIPDDHWHRIVAEVGRLSPEIVAAKRLPGPYERTRAALAVLLECGLRIGELVRLDTGCLVTAEDPATGQTTHWLRVPVGKLHNDRMIPVRPDLVALVDAWMRQRGPQPLHHDERTNALRDFLFAWQGWRLSEHALNGLIAYLCRAAKVPRYTSHQFRHTLAVQWRENGMRIETISQMLGHKDLKMTMRYAAVMPETVRREFDSAFAAIDEEYRTTAQVRVYLSPQAHLEAMQRWRESLWVDLGIGFCGLSACLPCDSRLACLPCPNFIATPESLPIYGRQRENLLELRMLGDGTLPAERKGELEQAVQALEAHIASVDATTIGVTTWQT